MARGWRCRASQARHTSATPLRRRAKCVSVYCECTLKTRASRRDVARALVAPGRSRVAVTRRGARPAAGATARRGCRVRASVLRRAIAGSKKAPREPRPLAPLRSKTSATTARDRRAAIRARHGRTRASRRLAFAPWGRPRRLCVAVDEGASTSTVVPRRGQRAERVTNPRPGARRVYNRPRLPPSVAQTVVDSLSLSRRAWRR